MQLALSNNQHLPRISKGRYRVRYSTSIFLDVQCAVKWCCRTWLYLGVTGCHGVEQVCPSSMLTGSSTQHAGIFLTAVCSLPPKKIFVSRDNVTSNENKLQTPCWPHVAGQTTCDDTESILNLQQLNVSNTGLDSIYTVGLAHAGSGC